MSEREISWGDEEEEVISAVPVVPVAPAPVQKKEKAPLPVPEWSVDTRADLPTSQALNHTAPAWPEENSNYDSCSEGNNYAGGNDNYNGNGYNKGDGYNNEYNGNNLNSASTSNSISASTPQWDQKPLNRRSGRGNPSREPREPRESRRDKLNDLSTLNLPGVDLSKMPTSSTRLSFSNNNSNNNNKNFDRQPRKERYAPSAPAQSETREEERRDVYERVNRITKEIDDLSWGETEQTEPVRVIEPVKAEHVRSFEPTRTSEPVRSFEPAPVKIINETGRLDDEGWGDEPEEPVRVSEPVKTESVRMSEPVRITEPVRVCEPVKAEPISVSEPVKNVTSPAAPMPQTTSMHHPHAQQMPYMMPAGFPYMMNPMSPVGQMSNPATAPMTCMPGMMIPIWVTCPFCYHCYMYPPVAPGSGPAPGATSIIQQQN